MAHITADRVKDTTTTTGIGTLTLANSAPTGYRTFGSVCANGDTAFYAVSHQSANEWEIGLGTYTTSGTTLARTTILKSSNSNAAVSFSAGTKDVFITAPADRLVQLNNEQVITLPAASNPTAPATNTLALYARKVSGRMLPKLMGPSGVDSPLQPAFFGNNIVMYMPNTGTTLGINLGTPWVAGGTVSHPTPATTAPAIVNQMKRTRFANVVTTTNQVLGVSSMASGVQQFWRGNATGLGGWFFFTRFIVELWPAATVRLFAGLSASTTAVVASDTVVNNTIGLWHDTTEAATVLNLVTRDATTTTKTPITLTGALAAGQAFDFYMFAKPNDTTVYYRLDDINAGTTLADTSISTTLPATTAFLGPQVHMSNGTANITVTTTAIGVNRIYIESDR